jgi:hypothetical protein
VLLCTDPVKDRSLKEVFNNDEPNGILIVVESIIEYLLSADANLWALKVNFL